MSVSTQKKQLILKTEWCKGCGICVAFCPQSVLRLENGKVILANAQKCIACGMCEMRCPDYAIYLREGAAALE